MCFTIHKFIVYCVLNIIAFIAIFPTVDAADNVDCIGQRLCPHSSFELNRQRSFIDSMLVEMITNAENSRMKYNRVAK